MHKLNVLLPLLLNGLHWRWDMLLFAVGIILRLRPILHWYPKPLLRIHVLQQCLRQLLICALRFHCCATIGTLRSHCSTVGSNNEIIFTVDSCAAQRWEPYFTPDSPKLTEAGFASTSEIRTSTILKWLQLWDKSYGAEVNFSGTTSLLNLIKIYQLVQTVGNTDRQSDWWSHKPPFYFLKESKLHIGKNDEKVCCSCYLMIYLQFYVQNLIMNSSQNAYTWRGWQFCPKDRSQKWNKLS